MIVSQTGVTEQSPFALPYVFINSQWNLHDFDTIFIGSGASSESSLAQCEFACTCAMSLDIGRRRYSPYGVAPTPPLVHSWGNVQQTIPGSDVQHICMQHGMDFWQRLPPKLIRTLCQHNVTSLSALQALGQSTLQQLRQDCGLSSAVCALLDALHSSDSLTPLKFIRLWLQIPKDGSCAQLHQALGTEVRPSQVRRAGPTPSANIALLQQASDAGWDAHALCASIVDVRIGDAVAPGTLSTYCSHMGQIECACNVLKVQALPASLETVRQVTSVVNNPTTLRGWLAAWRLAHVCGHFVWPGDRDPVLMAIRTGLHKRLGPLPMRRRCRRKLLVRVVRLAAQQRMWQAGALAVIAYTFGLRVPSELMRQARAALFYDPSPGRLSYGPIHRKGARQPRTLTRRCLCSRDRLLCPHDWLEILKASSPTGPLFTSSLSKLMSDFQSLAHACGEQDVHEFSSHCFRRGAAIDVLEEHGLKPMLQFGEWKSPQAAQSYGSADEQFARAMGSVLADLSDDERI